MVLYRVRKIVGPIYWHHTLKAIAGDISSGVTADCIAIRGWAICQYLIAMMKRMTSYHLQTSTAAKASDDGESNPLSGRCVWLEQGKQATSYTP